MAENPNNPSFTEPEYEVPTKVPVNPITRRQKFLAAIAGDAELPEPITETEKLLYNIAITIKSLAYGEDPLDGGTLPGGGTAN